MDAFTSIDMCVYNVAVIVFIFWILDQVCVNHLLLMMSHSFIWNSATTEQIQVCATLNDLQR